MSSHTPRWILASGLWFFASVAVAGDERHYSPTVGQDFPRKVYWGDTHVHTNLSPDAAAGGNRKFGHDQAYRLARGEVVTAHNGLPVRLNRSLDFLLVADHAENMGLFPGLEASDPRLLATETGRKWHAMLQAGPEEAAKVMVEYGDALRNRLEILNSPPFKKFVWQTVVASVDRAVESFVNIPDITQMEWEMAASGTDCQRLDNVGRQNRGACL